MYPIRLCNTEKEQVLQSIILMILWAFLVSLTIIGCNVFICELCGYNDYKCSNSRRGFKMSVSTSIRINQDLYEQAKQDAVLEHRSIAGQIEFWARVGRAALDNPDLPVSFVAESLASMSEPSIVA